MSLEIVRAGLHTTVQDGGRWGLQHLGVPVGGALDVVGLRHANHLVGNDPLEAALEVTLVGCEVVARRDVTVALAGARFMASVGGRPLPERLPFVLRAGQKLVLGERLWGARAYLAVRGGVDTPEVLGSRSAWPLLPRRGALVDGDVLPIGSRVRGPVAGAPTPPRAVPEALRIVAAPDAEGSDAVEGLASQTYRVASSASRMAYPLDGPPVHLMAPARASSGTVPGAIQVMPSGQPMLLMAERQTTGGYPIAAVLATADLPHAAQLAPGDPVRLVACTRAEALHALLQQESMTRAAR
jgi:antagonist of KipI